MKLVKDSFKVNAFLPDVKDYFPFLGSLKERELTINVKKKLAKALVTPLLTKNPVNSGETMPGMVAQVFDTPIKIEAYCGATSK